VPSEHTELHKAIFENIHQLAKSPGPVDPTAALLSIEDALEAAEPLEPLGSKGVLTDLLKFGAECHKPVKEWKVYGG
jgi:hypothetical protein